MKNLNQNISPIIDAKELLSLHDDDNLVLIDASNGKDTKSNYERKHLDGALFVDMNTQLADIHEDVSNGGRHPLPQIEAFAKTLNELGISNESHVIIYDDKNGTNAAARFWWMLTSAGHAKVQVLNGGFQAAEKIGFPANDDKVIPKKLEAYQVDKWQLPLSNIEEVEKVSEDNRYVVIDVRDNERYTGKIEPLDINSGHIPGAINLQYKDNLNSDGLFLSPEALKIKYEPLFNKVYSENIIVHCGSGVTACHTILSMASAGLPIPKLYVGSWSEWSNSNKKIVKE